MPSPWRTPLAALALGAALAAPGLAEGVEGGTVTGQVVVQPAKYQDETVVWLKDVPGPRAPATHELDQKNMKFRPLVLLVVAGDTVTFLNHDGVDHNVYSPDGAAFDLGTFEPGGTRSRAFEATGAFTVLCRLHPEMLGYVFVAPSRHAAVVDRKGRFTIGDVPPGTYQLAVWNAHLPGQGQPVTVAAGQAVEVTLSVKR